MKETKKDFATASEGQSDDAPADLQQLKALALAATPGPWVAGEPIPGAPRFLVADCGPVGKVYPADQKPSHGTTSMDDAKFIAAANPAVVLDLIARIEHEREVAASWQRTAEKKDRDWNEARMAFENYKCAQRDAIAASRRAAGGGMRYAGESTEWLKGRDEGLRQGRAVIDIHNEQMANNRHYRERVFNQIIEQDAAEGLSRFAHLATPASASAGQAAPAMIEQYDGPWPTVEMTVAGKRMLEKQTSIEHIKKYSAGIANSIYEAMHAASPVGIAAQPAEGAGQAGQVAKCCTVPPPGWYCTRAAGHEGPCAAHQSSVQVES